MLKTVKFRYKAMITAWYGAFSSLAAVPLSSVYRSSVNSSKTGVQRSKTHVSMSCAVVEMFLYRCSSPPSEHCFILGIIINSRNAPSLGNARKMVIMIGQEEEPSGWVELYVFLYYFDCYDNDLDYPDRHKHLCVALFWPASRWMEGQR